MDSNFNFNANSSLVILLPENVPTDGVSELSVRKQYQSYWSYLTTTDTTHLQAQYFIPHPFKNHIKVEEGCFNAFSFSIRLDNLCPPLLD